MNTGNVRLGGVTNQIEEFIDTSFARCRTSVQTKRKQSDCPASQFRDPRGRRAARSRPRNERRPPRG
jgi:hypothetical protein